MICKQIFSEVYFFNLHLTQQANLGNSSAFSKESLRSKTCIGIV